MIFNLKRPGVSGLPVIDFDGEMLSAFSGDEWEAAFLESGTIRFNSNPGECDIFLVANGKQGGAVKFVLAGQGYYYGGAGGDGGEYVLTTVTLLPGVDYTLTIGDTSTLAGAGLTLSTANGVAGKSGGRPGCVAGVRHQSGSTIIWDSGSIVQQPATGTDGIFAYNDVEDKVIITELIGKRFCAGGGGGDAFISGLGLYTSDDNGGGETDGGHGAQFDHGTGTEATTGGANTGSGAGGPYFGYYQGDEPASQRVNGGSGICLIRRHRGN